jgi:hypothetical protein
LPILATLRKSGGISALSRQLGTSPSETIAAADALLPELLAYFLNHGGGMEGLLKLVDAAGGGAMAQAIMIGKPVDAGPGALLLAQLQGQGSPAWEEQPGTAEVDPELRQRMLPLLAMLLGGYLSARALGGGLDMAQLASLLDARKSFYSPGEEKV